MNLSYTPVRFLLTFSFSAAILASSSSAEPLPTLSLGYEGAYSPPDQYTAQIIAGDPESAIVKVTASESGNKQAWVQTGVIITPSSQLEITSPVDGSNFQLTDRDYRAVTIPFSADSYDPVTPIDWSENLHYQTSGGRTVPDDDRELRTVAQETHKEKFASVGGQLISTISQVNARPGNQSTQVTTTITGSVIPDDTITPYLAGLYTGAGAITNILAAIADVESSYKQFKQRTLYSTKALWPTESGDGGSHIGLMMVDTVQNGMGGAFDWQQNAQFGLNILQQGLSFADRFVKRTRKKNMGLRDLSAEERENVALSYYRVGGKNAYYDVDDSSGTPEWVVNEDGDPIGVGYVKCVRLQTPPVPVDCNFQHPNL